MADFEWYRSFVAVYQTGTVSAAARRRSLTQPAISQHLSALESRHKSSLFQRTPRRMVPTAAGQELYGRVIEAVERLEFVTGAAHPTNSHPLTLHVGAPREYFHDLGLASLAKAPPANYRIAINFGETPELIGRLANNNLDAVIATQRFAIKQIDYAELAREEFRIVAPKRMKIPKGLGSTRLEQWLRTQPWISYGPDLPLIRRYWQIAFGRRPDIMPRFIIPDLLSIIHAVELGLGISVVPSYLCRSALQRKTIRLIPAPRRSAGNQLFLACLAHRRSHTEIEWLRHVFTARTENHP